MGSWLAQANQIVGELASKVANGHKELRHDMLYFAGLIALAEERPEAVVRCKSAYTNALTTDQKLLSGLALAQALYFAHRQLECKELIGRMSRLNQSSNHNSCRPDVQREFIYTTCITRLTTGVIETATTLLNDSSNPLLGHQKFRLLTTISALKLKGGDVSGAVDALEKAGKIAEKHRCLTSSLHTSTHLAQIEMKRARFQQAKTHLSDSLATAQELNDSNTVVWTATLLCAILMANEQWNDAISTAAIEHLAANLRSNWLAVADAAITTASCHLALGRLELAETHIKHTAEVLKHRGAVAAVELLKARLAEIKTGYSHS